VRIRRYEVIEDSREVQERVVRALLERALAHLRVELADVYEGPLPIPAEIAQRDVTFSVQSLSRSGRGSLRAFGFMLDGGAVRITIPKNQDERSVLLLVDASQPAACPDAP
jgi:hypothetical protein